MLDRAVHIVGAASGRGARNSGCEAGPEALRRSILSTRLWRAGLNPVWDSIFCAASGMDNTEAVRSLCSRVAERVCGIAAGGAFPLVLGGDHSCAIGTWSGVASAIRPRGRLGLIWVDAHMDAHTPATSPSAALHGMPLGCLLGHGEPSLVALMESQPLAAESGCGVGVRGLGAGQEGLLYAWGRRG